MGDGVMLNGGLLADRGDGVFEILVTFVGLATVDQFAVGIENQAMTVARHFKGCVLDAVDERELQFELLGIFGVILGGEALAPSRTDDSYFGAAAFVQVFEFRSPSCRPGVWIGGEGAHADDGGGFSFHGSFGNSRPSQIATKVELPELMHLLG